MSRYHTRPCENCGRAFSARGWSAKLCPDCADEADVAERAAAAERNPFERARRIICESGEFTELQAAALREMLDALEEGERPR